MTEADEQVIRRAFERWNQGEREIDPAGPDRYVLVGSIHGRGRHSGVDLDQPASWVIETRRGRFLRLIHYIGRDGAREAVAET